MSRAAMISLIIIIILIIIGAAFLLMRPSGPTTTSTPAATTTTTVKTTTKATTKTTVPPTTTKTTAAKKPTILRVAFAWPTYIDPAVGSDYSSSTAFTNLYDPLVFPTPDGNVKPWVATEWNVSSDGLTWTFKIRKGIKFHSGRELTAEDVAFSMNRLLKIGQGYAYLFSPYVEETKVLDKYTVQFKLKKPFGPFLITLARLYILDKQEVMSHIKKPGSYGEYGDFATEWLLTHDAGSGPYKVKDVKLEEYVDMVKFPDYWGPISANSPDEIRFVAVTDPSTTKAMMAKKELEISSQWLPEETIAALDKMEGIDIAKIPMQSEFYLMMDIKKPPLDDIHVRKAIAYAFDYKTVVTEIFPGSPLVDGPVPSTLPGYCKTGGYTTNLEKAKEELKKSKYWPDISKNPDKYTIVYHWIAEVPAEEKVAILFASNMQKIGLKVKIVKVPWTKVVDEMAKEETSPHIVSIFVAAHYAEAGSLLESRYHSKSAATWEQNEWLLDPKLDKMIEDALSTIDRQARFKKYCEIEKYITDLSPSLFLFQQISKFAYQSSYVIWPQAQGKDIIPVMGYNIDGRTIQVLPTKS